MIHAVMTPRAGGLEVLEYVELPDPVAGEGQVVVRHEAVGLNFIDTYQRSGLYPGTFPRILGNEAAGVVESVGPGVTRLKAGDRVAYVNQPGGYSEKNAVIASRVVKLPGGASTRIAAAAMLKGMTARFLTRIWPLAEGDTVLVHAAAGGVGSILTQWLTYKGIKVIGTAGSPEKAALAKGHGCIEVILYRDEDVAERVRVLTGGAGVKVAYDAVGKATFDGSLASVAKQQLLVLFGNASGPVPPVDPLRLSRAGSLFLTRPTLFDYIASTESLDEASAELFEVIASGAVKIEIGQEWALKDIREAHRALESRETIGATLLIP